MIKMAKIVKELNIIKSSYFFNSRAKNRFKLHHITKKKQKPQKYFVKFYENVFWVNNVKTRISSTDDTKASDPEI